MKQLTAPNRLQRLYIGIVLVVGYLITMITALPTPAYAAAQPGCYTESGGAYVSSLSSICVGLKDSSGKDITATTVKSVCYVRAQIAPAVDGAYARRDCASFTPATTKTPNTEVIGVARDCEKGLDAKNCGISRYLLIFTNALSAVVGVVVVITIVVAGIQYSAAGSNPQAVASARNKIRNALIALFAYIFMFAFLEWLIPGGLI